MDGVVPFPVEGVGLAIAVSKLVVRDTATLAVDTIVDPAKVPHYRA
jgi:hypothetical protein